LAVPEVHKLDDPARIEKLIKDSHFESWDAVTGFVAGYEILIADVGENLHAADPNAGMSSRSAFLWGTALALKLRSYDPCTAAIWIARGLHDFTLPEGSANKAGFADGFGKLASILLQGWMNGMAIIGTNCPEETIQNFSSLAKLAEKLRGRKWDVMVLCDREKFQEHLFDGEFKRVEVEFVCEAEQLRVTRSTTAMRKGNTSVSVFPVSIVEEGVAVLEFEAPNLCITLSTSSELLFAHPIAGIYARKARSAGRLIRVCAAECQEEYLDCKDQTSNISRYMADLYADFILRGIVLDAEGMESVGFPMISGAGAIKAIMKLAHRVASVLKQHE
jgi:hypothetical protein